MGGIARAYRAGAQGRVEGAGRKRLCRRRCPGHRDGAGGQPAFQRRPWRSADGSLHHELDASIMDGATLAAGAVAGVTRIRNPIAAARTVMESGKAVLLIGAAAEAFVARGALRWSSLVLHHPEAHRRAREPQGPRGGGTLAKASEAEKHGTVGAVARDRRGHLVCRHLDRRLQQQAGGTCRRQPDHRGGGPTRGTASAPSPARGRAKSSSASRRRTSFRRASGSAGRRSRRRAAISSTMSRRLRDRRRHDLPRRGGRPFAPYNTLGMYRGWIDTKGAMVVGTHEELHRMEIGA